MGGGAGLLPRVDGKLKNTLNCNALTRFKKL